VLEVINKGETEPIRIMYSANLSWFSFQKIINLLESKGYVMELSGSVMFSKRQYVITDTGCNVLNYHKRLEKIVKEKITL
jgi:predicted transcriptional regulator